MAARGNTLIWKLLWHLLVVASILLVPKWLVLQSLTQPMTRINTAIRLALAGSYAAAVLISTVWRPDIGHTRSLLTIAVAATCLSVVLAALILAAPQEFSQRMLVFATAILAAGIAGSTLLANASRRSLIWAIVALLLLASSLVFIPRSTKAIVGVGTRSETVRANDKILSVSYFARYFPPPPNPTVLGGAIARDPVVPGYLVVRARGDVYRVSWDAAGRMQVEDLEIRVPINYTEYQADVRTRAPTWGFRVADIAVQRQEDSTRLYVSHHHWMRDRQCFVVRVSTVALTSLDRAPSAGQRDWQTIFESRPCLPIKLSRGAAFGGEQLGGNLEFLNERSLILTVGDNKFDGFHQSPDYVSDPSAHYGKTVTIDLRTGEAAIFTRGHRNPQGLAMSSDGQLWSTEHGPQGGDELNLLHEGGNYGYPFHTYGVEYGSVTWPPSAAATDHHGDLRPIFAWVPSIGISDLIVVSDPDFGGWNGDMMIGSLLGQAVWRVRLEDQRVVFAEPIPIGERVRDIAAGPGELVLWTDSETIVRISPLKTLNDGAALFTLRCGGCHDPIRHMIGPDLRNLLGRRIAGAQGYDYSTALRQVGGRWTEERLNEFLASPSAFAPGTTMAAEGVADGKVRQQLIEYIKLYE
ncbi:MAG: PQQ-dependent sugar dehydrogenase [Steroidobacteraceae bacterium]